MGDKSVAYKASKTISSVQIGIGGFFTVCFVLMFLILIIDALFVIDSEPLDAYDFLVLFIVLAPSAFLWSRGIKRKKLLKLTKDYTIRLNADPYKSTATLANSLGVPENLVIDNLNKMIQKNYFPGAVLNYAERRVSFPGQQPQNPNPNPGRPAYTPASATQTADQAIHAAKPAAVTCKGCGAINHFDPHSPKAACEYCGAHLER